MSVYNTTILAETSLLHYWELDEASGATSFADSKGIYTGAYNNSPTIGVAGGISGLSVGFVAASSQNLSSGATSTLDAPFSVELWFKTATGTEAKLFGTRQSNGNYFDLGIASTTGIHADIGNGGNSGWISTAVDGTAGASFADNAWHHLVVTIATGAYVVYLNAVSIGSGALGSTGRLWSNGIPIRFAWNNIIGDPFFTGGIDEVAVYNDVLSAGQVTAHYNAAFAVSGGLLRPLALDGLGGTYMRDPLGV